MHVLHLSTSAALYLGATALLIGVSRFGAWARWAGIALGACALGLHFTSLYPLLVTSWVPAPGNMYSTTIWAMALLMTLATPIPAARPLLVVLYPAAALSLPLLQAGIPGTEVNLGFRVHLGLSVLALGLVVLAGLQALLLGLRERSLHGGKLGRLTARMPSLQELDTFLFQVITAAFFLLSLSLASGLAYPADPYGPRLTHKAVLSLLAALIFGILIIGRRVRGWRGLVAVRWTLGGSLTLLLAYFGSLLFAL